MTARTTIEVRIDRLVLHGVPGLTQAGAQRVADDLRTELARVLSDLDPATLTASPLPRGSARITLPPGGQLGTALAAVVRDAVTGPSEGDPR